MVKVLLKISLHISFTALIVFLFYWFVYRHKDDMQPEELREQMWSITIVVVVLCIALMVVSIIIK